MAASLAQLLVLLVGNGGAVYINRNLPAKGLVEAVVLGGGRQILVSSYHVSNLLQMIVHHIGEIVGWEAVGFNQNHVVQLRVVHADVSVNLVVERGRSLCRIVLADNERLSCRQVRLYLLLGQVQAVLVIGHNLLAVYCLLQAV